MKPAKLTVLEIAQLVSGKLVDGDEGLEIVGVQTLANAEVHHASFLSNVKYKADLEDTKAGLVFLKEGIVIPEGVKAAVVMVKDPYVAFTLLQRHFHPDPVSKQTIHDSASIDSGANISKSTQVDAHVSIAAGVSIGEGSIIGAGCVLEEGVTIGENCLLHPRVVLAKNTVLGDRVIIQAGAVLGSDGFGFAWTGTEFLKIPQVGRVIIEDDVEIGANTCVDRGAIDDTIIRAGAKLDNLVQVAHNVEIGSKTVIAGQAGIAGSTVMGSGCQMGGQAAVSGHLKVADGVIIGGKAGVIGDIKEPGMVSGFPAVPHRQWLRASGMFDRLPEVWKKIKKLSDGAK